MNHPADYPSQKDDFDLRKFLNVGRSATQNSFGAPSFKYIKPGDPKPPHWLNRLSRIEPIIGEVKERAKFSNAYITPALFNLGGKDTKENICGFWGWVIDEDVDKGIVATLPPGFTPTFTLQSSVSEGTINRQLWLIFTRILSPKEGEALIEKLVRKCGADNCSKNIAQYFRIPGGLNHPTEKKIAAGRSPEPQRVTIIGEGGLIDPDALSQALDAMLDHPEAAKARAVVVDGINPTTTAALLQRIREKDGQLFDLMQLESTPGDARPDRSMHFARVVKRLFEVDLSVDEVTAVAIGAPFAVKFAGREAQRVAAEYGKWAADQDVKARAANNWQRLADNVVRHPRAFDGSAAEDEAARTEAQGDRKPGEWPELQPLARREAKHDYPIEALPDQLRAAVVAVSGVMKVPAEMAAISALSALSAAAQGLVDVCRSSELKLSGPISLYTLSVVESGGRKSAVDKLFTSAIDEFEKRKNKDLESEIKKAKSEYDAWDYQRKGILEKIKKEKKGMDLSRLRNY